jgi:hypothetical protein
MELQLTDRIAANVITYYAKNDVQQIAHTQCVVSYTHLIASADNRQQHNNELLECAAWLHDIGCPSAKKKYGNSKPEHQMSEGRIIAPQILAKENALNDQEKKWITDVVGTHHQLRSALELHFEPLFEADLIVNLLEGYYPMTQAETFLKMVHTPMGRKLYCQLTNLLLEETNE